MNKKVEKRVCPVCGKKFTPAAHNQVFCCVKCKRLSGKKKPADKVKGDAKTNCCADKPKNRKNEKKFTEKIKLPAGDGSNTTSIYACGKNDPVKMIALAFGVMIEAFIQATETGKIKRIV